MTLRSFNRLPNGKSIVAEGGRIVGLAIEFGDVRVRAERFEYTRKCWYHFAVDGHNQVQDPVGLLPRWPNLQIDNLETLFFLRPPIVVTRGAVLEARQSRCSDTEPHSTS